MSAAASTASRKAPTPRESTPCSAGVQAASGTTFIGLLLGVSRAPGRRRISLVIEPFARLANYGSGSGRKAGRAGRRGRGPGPGPGRRGGPGTGPGLVGAGAVVAGSEPGPLPRAVRDRAGQRTGLEHRQEAGGRQADGQYGRGIAVPASIAGPFRGGRGPAGRGPAPDPGGRGAAPAGRDRDDQPDQRPL